MGDYPGQRDLVAWGNLLDSGLRRNDGLASPWPCRFSVVTPAKAGVQLSGLPGAPWHTDRSTNTEMRSVLHPKQIEAFRAMTPARKLEVAMQLCWSARRLKAGWLRKIHPDWTEDRVEEEVRRIFLHART